jgi:serine protease Do
MVAQRRPGDRVEVGYYRDGVRRETTVRLDQSPLTAPARPAAARSVPEAQQRLGIALAPMDEKTAADLGLEDAGGVLIRSLDPNGAAAREGLTGGRLLSLNRQPVRTVEEAERILAGLRPGEVLSIRIEGLGGATRVVNMFVPS